MKDPDRFLSVYCKDTEKQHARYKLSAEEFYKLKILMHLPPDDPCIECYPILKDVFSELNTAHFAVINLEQFDCFLESESV